MKNAGYIPDRANHFPALSQKLILFLDRVCISYSSLNNRSGNAVMGIAVPEQITHRILNNNLPSRTVRNDGDM